MIFFLLLAIFIFGAIIGSFLNVLILRLPANRQANGRSQCMRCGKVLEARDLVPILSFLFLRGKCRHCHAPISKRYIAIETITGFFFCLNYLFFTFSAGPGLLFFLRICFITCVLIVVFVIDLEHFLILDRVVFPAVALLFALNIALGIVEHQQVAHSYAFIGVISGLGLALFFWLLHAISKGRWIGFGDVKFALFLGLATPFPFILMTVVLSTLFGTVWGIFAIAFQQKHISSRIPYGTFLAIAVMATLYFGNSIYDWYVHLVGIATY